MLEFQFVIASLVAGMLTILAPCMVPILPIILGGSVSDTNPHRKALVITASLTGSIVLFTLLVRATTERFMLTQSTLNNISGVILLVFGVITLLPEVWDWLSLKLGLSTKANSIMNRFTQGNTVLSNVLLGSSLGPVFTSCSPTYVAILALTIQGDISMVVATIYTLLYGLGLAVMLLLIAFAGQRVVKKLGWATNPHGTFKRVVGVLFILIGISIMTGIDKKIENQLLDWGVYEPLAEFENKIRN